jgi:HAD superfamily hydrolase (TIGR01490 family)
MAAHCGGDPLRLDRIFDRRSQYWHAIGLTPATAQTVTTVGTCVVNYFCIRQIRLCGSQRANDPGRRMTSAGSPVAVFDLDGTVTRRDTYLAYLMYVLQRRGHRVPYCLGLPAAVLQFKRGRLSNDTLKCRFLAAILGGCSRSEIERHTAGFVEICVTRMVKPAARARIARHHRQGHRLVLASASLDVYATALGTRLGFDDVVCTRVAWVADEISGSLAGPNLLSEAKLAAVKEALTMDERGCGLMFAYSDHHSDLPLLLFAKHGVAVDPTPPLAAAAAAYGLRIEKWR